MLRTGCLVVALVAAAALDAPKARAEENPVVQVTQYNTYAAAPSSIDFVLARRAALSLSSDQIRQLELLNVKHKKELIPRLAERDVLELDMRQHSLSPGDQTSVIGPVLQKIETLNSSIRLAEYRATLEMKAVLTPDQLKLLPAQLDNLAAPRDPTAGALERKIDEALAQRVKDQKLVQIETSQAIAEKLTGWAQSLAFLIGVPIGILALALGALGIKSYSDFSKIVKEARESVDKSLTQTRESFTEAQSELKDFNDNIESARTYLEKTKSETEALNASARLLLTEAESRVSNIRSTETLATKLFQELEVQAAVVGPITLQPQEVEGAPTAAKARGKHGLWAVGQTLRVRFMGGDEEAHKVVKTCAEEWMKYANVTFEIGSSAKDAEIRIAFKKDEGNWAFVGTQCLSIPINQQVMNVGAIHEASILKGFGHILGLINEHQNPKAKIPWDTEAIYRELGGPPNNWPKQTVKTTLLTKADKASFSWYRDFDPDSVMMTPIPATWTAGRFEVAGNTELSDGDKTFIAKLYPRA
jgi:F0F1-type ATP synthase membrane subunit b/b'